MIIWLHTEQPRNGKPRSFVSKHDCYWKPLFNILSACSSICLQNSSSACNNAPSTIMTIKATLGFHRKPNAECQSQKAKLCLSHWWGTTLRWQPPLQNHKVNSITITDHGRGFLIKPPVMEVLWGSSSGFIFSAIANKKTVTYHQIQKAQKTWLSIANTTTFPFQLASEGKAGLQKGAPEISSS